MDRRRFVHHVNVQTELFIKSYTNQPQVFHIIFAIVLVFIVFFSFYRILILSFLAIAGILIADSFLKSNVIFSGLLSSSDKDSNYDCMKIERKCPICGRADCQRHRPGLSINSIQPWLQLKIPSSVNDSLEEFFNLILNNYVHTWYNEISKDESFMEELRFNIRYAVAVIYQRLKRVDLAKLVTQKVLRLSLKHLSVCMEVVTKYGREYASQMPAIEEDIVASYASNLHGAVRNRRAEIDYLKQLSEKVFTFVLPTHSQHCRCLHSLIREVLTSIVLLPSMDLIADPDIINDILILIFSKTPAEDYSAIAPTPSVPILNNFTRAHFDNNQKTTQLKLSQVLLEMDHLYSFMQFMKAEGTVNVLQFYLVIEEFNRKILTPELSTGKIAELHQELIKIYEDFVNPEAFERIHLASDIIDELRTICKGNPDSILKLQTTTPLFRAYEFTYDLLENTFLPLFQQSDTYYSMICGERWSTKIQRSHSRISKKNSDTISRLSTKFKSAFKSNTVEGRPIPDEVDFNTIEVDDSMLSESSSFLEGLTVVDSGTTDSPLRNLSTWRVTIPKVITKVDPFDPYNAKKFNFAFAVEVHKIDVQEGADELEGWSIERRYAEFFVLESKLREFHGEFENLQLPQKKTFIPKNRQFFETIRPDFEKYLQILLTKPILHGSELLYSFLKSEQEFSTGFLEMNLGKKVRSGAMKLMKEKGQHLETFLKSFLVSTETTRPKPLKYPEKDADSLSISSEKMAFSIYGNNANVEVTTTIEDAMTAILEDEVEAGVKDSLVEGISSVYDAIVYLVDCVFTGPIWLLHILLLMRMMLRNTLDQLILMYTRHKFDVLLNEHRVTEIVHLLRDVLFFDTDLPRTEENKLERKKAALKDLTDFIPGIFSKLVSQENATFGCTLLFNLLQQPKLNKQLSYTLLDEAILELFPEINENLSTS